MDFSTDALSIFRCTSTFYFRQEYINIATIREQYMSFLFSLISSVLFMTSYMEDGSFPKPLSKKDEATYFDAAKKGDIEAKNKLVEHNMRLVVHIAKKYVGSMDSEDLLSVGSIGLLKAIKTFDYAKGTQFATYASRCIDNEILMTLRSNRKHNNNISIQSPIGVDKDGNEITLLETLCNEDYDLTKKVEDEYVSEKLKEVMQRVLSPREYDIICIRYGLNGKEVLPQREVAEKYGISRSYISRIEKKAVIKIRAYLQQNRIDLR